ncbi:CapA family protein [Pseudonocardia sp. RS010]|uniref:CapA family protein n=1 Tax=Pseudonocardia sp. RS010 TaxID=3385979 RepID=UPI0039A2D0D3
MTSRGRERRGHGGAPAREDLTIFLSGDVMLGRGIDQILPHPGDPQLRERSVRDARTYVHLAEAAGGAVPQPVEPGWPWGDLAAVLGETAPDARVVNLETAVTTSSSFAPHKAVHYRMHPANLPTLHALHPDVCCLANNHVLDFGTEGLRETLDVLAAAGLRTAGAGRDATEAWRPAVVPLTGGRRLVVLSVAHTSSGVPPGWAATATRPGVALVADDVDRSVDEVVASLAAVHTPDDIAVVSVHRGSNWGYEVGAEQRRFAHGLVDAGVDLVHGHSSHHPRPVEVHRGRLVLHGCGDLVDDYEGVSGYEEYRADLRLAYLATLDPTTGALRRLRMVPLRSRRLRLQRASAEDAEWLAATLDRAGRPYGSRVRTGAHHLLDLATV